MPVEIENSDFVMKLLNCPIHLILKIHYLKFPLSFYQKKIAKVQTWCLLNPEYARVMFQEGLQNIYSKYEFDYYFQLGAIHKRHRNILGGEGGLKFRCCNKLEGRSWVNRGQNFDMGEGVSKTAKKFRRLLWTAPCS